MYMFFFLTRLPVAFVNCGRALVSWAASEIEWVIASLAESCYTAAILILWALAPLASRYCPCREKEKVAERCQRSFSEVLPPEIGRGCSPSLGVARAGGHEGLADNKKGLQSHVDCSPDYFCWCRRKDSNFHWETPTRP
jgi:hypothetical protein